MVKNPVKFRMFKFFSHYFLFVVFSHIFTSLVSTRPTNLTTLILL